MRKFVDYLLFGVFCAIVCVMIAVMGTVCWLFQVALLDDMPNYKEMTELGEAP